MSKPFSVLQTSTCTGKPILSIYLTKHSPTPCRILTPFDAKLFLDCIEDIATFATAHTPTQKIRRFLVTVEEINGEQQYTHKILVSAAGIRKLNTAINMILKHWYDGNDATEGPEGKPEYSHPGRITPSSWKFVAPLGRKVLIRQKSYQEIQEHQYKILKHHLGEL